MGSPRSDLLPNDVIPTRRTSAECRDLARNGSAPAVEPTLTIPPRLKSVTEEHRAVDNGTPDAEIPRPAGEDAGLRDDADVTGAAKSTN